MGTFTSPSSTSITKHWRSWPRNGRRCNSSAPFHSSTRIWFTWRLACTALPVEDQDLVYTIGVIDYFSDDLVVKLLNAVHGMLRPGGRVIVGNFHPRNPFKAFMDRVLEWELTHRTERDLDRLLCRSRFCRPSGAILYEPQRINILAECVKA